MSLPAGEHVIGPDSGELVLRTYRQGMAAKVGHDLVIEAGSWQGTVTIPPGGAVEGAAVVVEVDLGALRVREGSGGVAPLSAKDRTEIEANMRRQLKVDAHPKATFRSTAAHGSGSQAVVDGELTLAGTTAPLSLQVREEDGVVRGEASVLQSRWGIKPYSAFLGALRLRDAVDVQFSLRLASAS